MPWRQWGIVLLVLMTGCGSSTIAVDAGRVVEADLAFTDAETSPPGERNSDDDRCAELGRSIVDRDDAAYLASLEALAPELAPEVRAIVDDLLGADAEQSGPSTYAELFALDGATFDACGIPVITAGAYVCPNFRRVDPEATPTPTPEVPADCKAQAYEEFGGFCYVENGTDQTLDVDGETMVTIRVFDRVSCLEPPPETAAAEDATVSPTCEAIPVMIVSNGGELGLDRVAELATALDMGPGTVRLLELAAAANEGDQEAQAAFVDLDLQIRLTQIDGEFFDRCGVPILSAAWGSCVLFEGVVSSLDGTDDVASLTDERSACFAELEDELGGWCFSEVPLAPGTPIDSRGEPARSFERISCIDGSRYDPTDDNDEPSTSFEKVTDTLPDTDPAGDNDEPSTSFEKVTDTLPD